MITGEREKINRALNMIRRRFPSKRFKELNLTCVFDTDRMLGYFRSKVDIVHLNPYFTGYRQEIPIQMMAEHRTILRSVSSFFFFFQFSN